MEREGVGEVKEEEEEEEMKEENRWVASYLMSMFLFKIFL